jgi:hypothetical protein
MKQIQEKYGMAMWEAAKLDNRPALKPALK